MRGDGQGGPQSEEVPDDPSDRKTPDDCHHERNPRHQRGDPPLDQTKRTLPPDRRCQLRCPAQVQLARAQKSEK
jgi:hypothetical protein